MKTLTPAALLLLSLLAACGGTDPTGATAADAVAARRQPPPPPPPSGMSIVALNRQGSPLEGNELILIVGNLLDPAATVTFGGVPALSSGPDTITHTSGLLAVTPPHETGYVDVVVTNPDGTSATFPQFRYYPPPVIDSFSPGAVARGDSITVTGSFLDDPKGVQLSVGPYIAQVTSSSATEIVAVVPKMNAGSYRIYVARFDSQSAFASGTLEVVQQ